jgi:CPA1 family monovalent cation:H+ antiporter
MQLLEQLLYLFVAAVALAGAARKCGAPYPVFLALGGTVIALLPIGPAFTLPPDVALALFVAPVLLDSAYDMSTRDLRDNWLPVTGLVVFSVALTTAAVALVAHSLVPALPWAAAVALGAMVAPPDAVAAGAVLRPMLPPQRLVTILEGESLFNDATALMIYHLALGAVAAHSFSMGAVGPAFILNVVGSMLAGPMLAWCNLWVMARLEHVPTAIILQFVVTFGVWIVADEAGLSAVLTMVCFAITMKRSAPKRLPARVRIPTNAVWGTAVFALNILAFTFIGMQLQPIMLLLDPATLLHYLAVAGAVLATVIAVRFAWYLPFNAAMRWHHRRAGFHPPHPMLRPTFGSGLVISWAGMRGIVTLAAAMALPRGFPQRDLIIVVAFGVAVGTLVIQGLTLKPLLRALDLHDDDPVGQEIDAGRITAFKKGMASIAAAHSPAADAVRARFEALMRYRQGCEGAADEAALYARALRTARQGILAMRASDEIGDDAFRNIEEELDWLEMALGAGGQVAESETPDSAMGG